VLEVNAIYFILLAEGFVLLLILLLVWVLIVLVGKRHKRRNLAELEARIKHRSQQRSEQTKSFLQTIYHLEGEDLNAALENIDRTEKEFFQHLLDKLYRGDRAQLTSMDTALDELIESYKCLQPRSESTSQEELEVVEEIVSLRVENETLRSELSAAKDKLSDTISEFGDMFGGGKDHQLSLHEVVERIDAMKADNDSGEPLKAQK